MFKKRLGAMADKLSSASKDLTDDLPLKVESYITANLPAVSEACNRALANASRSGKAAGMSAKEYSAILLADEERFKTVVAEAFSLLPLPRFIPRWLFVRTCLKHRSALVALIGPAALAPAQAETIGETSTEDPLG